MASALSTSESRDRERAPTFLFSRDLSNIRICARFTIDGYLRPPSSLSRTTLTGYFLIVVVMAATMVVLAWMFPTSFWITEDFVGGGDRGAVQSKLAGQVTSWGQAVAGGEASGSDEVLNK